VRTVVDPVARSAPVIERIFADASYRGEPAALAAAHSGDWTIEIAQREELETFLVLPK
jgi:hypothetical protein